MEATVFTGWIYDHVQPHAAGLKVAASDLKPAVAAVLGGKLSDSQGYQTAIGSTDLSTPRTGETHKTSAASVVLIGKDKRVLWSAP